MDFFEFHEDFCGWHVDFRSAIFLTNNESIIDWLDLHVGDYAELPIVISRPIPIKKLLPH